MNRAILFTLQYRFHLYLYTSKFPLNLHRNSLFFFALSRTHTFFLNYVPLVASWLYLEIFRTLQRRHQGKKGVIKKKKKKENDVTVQGDFYIKTGRRPGPSWPILHSLIRDRRAGARSLNFIANDIRISRWFSRKRGIME